MIVAFCVAAIGCNQSLFDSNPDNRDAGGVADAVDLFDAPVTTSCPEPCAGDAVEEFGTSQGGASGNWFYLTEGEAASGADYSELTYGLFGDLEAWAASVSGPAIAKCDGSADANCAGLDGYLVLVPGSGGVGVPTIPALSFRAPENATYRVSGAVRVADGSTEDVAAQFLISRNAKHDATVLQTYRTSTTESALSGTISALAGDELILSIAVADTTPIGFRVYFTRVDDGAEMFPGDCQAAIRFGADDMIVDSCRGAVVDDLNDGIGPPGTSVVAPAASARLGNARDLAEGQYLKIGNSPMNYTGDFTIQFWTKTPEPLPSFDSTPYADWNTAVKGGVAVFMDQDSTVLDFCYMAHGGAVEIEDCTRGTRPVDGEWHFWRIVRSTAEGTLRLCTDGVENVQVQIPGTDDMTSDEPPRMGRNVTYNPAYYGGSMDDIRVYSSALPCSTVPVLGQ